MKKEIAQKTTKAIISTNHPLLDFRSKEAKKQIEWIGKYLKPYITPKIKLIDIGCGAGKQSFEAERLGAQVIGIDCSQEAINFANHIKKQLASNCQFILGNYTQLPFKKKFDIAIFPNNIIECSYSEMEKVIQQVKKILKNNGKFIMTMKDEVIDILQNTTHDFTNYSSRTGKNEGKITLPNKKQYSYPTYFWTVPFAKHLISKKFKLLKEEKIDTNQYLLIFANKKTAI